MAASEGARLGGERDKIEKRKGLCANVGGQLQGSSGGVTGPDLSALQIFIPLLHRLFLYSRITIYFLQREAWDLWFLAQQHVWKNL